MIAKVPNENAPKHRKNREDTVSSLCSLIYRILYYAYVRTHFLSLIVSVITNG